MKSPHLPCNGMRLTGLALVILFANLVLHPTAKAADPASWQLSASSYLGYPGSDDEVFGARILSDGTLVLAAQIGDKSFPGTTPVLLLNGSDENTSGAIVRLSSDGKNILSVSRIANEIRDLEIDASDNLFVAAGHGGLIQLNPTADTVVATREVGRFVKRVTVGGDKVAILIPDSLTTPHTSPGPSDIILFDSNLVELNRMRGFRNTLDLAIHPASETLAIIGWRQANAWQQDGAGILPVQIAYLRGMDFEGNVKWDAYDWDTGSNINGGNEFAATTIQVGDTTIPQGFIVVTNPYFLNSTGQPIGTLPEPDGRTVYGFLNNMADTRGYRLTVGEDGYLYAAFEAAGGNHIFRRRGQRDSTLANFRESTNHAGGSLFNSFINTGAGHKTYIGRYEAATGHKVRGNQFNTLISSSSGPSANTLRMTQGGMYIDAEGRLYFGAAAASGLPLPGNPLFSPVAGESSLHPFGLASNEGGAYLWIVDSDMATRLFVGRIANGNTRTIHARSLSPGELPTVVWGGRAALSRPMYVRNPVQAQPGYGDNDGFFAVLSSGVASETGGRVVFEYGVLTLPHKPLCAVSRPINPPQ
ncbi:MAG: hypothetical protein LR015_00075 [Verrucomicrobia bacterium]|nr:hypothetical protein [Verrucomicrobiota bacterium]